MSDLQLALIALGVVLVAAVLGYNKWQERKHRKLAEQAFRSEHPDVLLQAGNPQPEAAAGPLVQRVEPTLAAPDAEPQPEPAGDFPERPPAELADERIDCMVRFESAEGIAAGYLWQTHRQTFARLARPVRWLGLDEGRGEWRMLTPHDAGSYRRLWAVLQVADRRGAVTEAELALFLGGMQQLAEQFLAVADMPPRAEILAQAAEVDRFCASVDVQIGVNVVSRDSHAFAGTKLRGLAEAAGLALQGDGLFHCADEQGATLFTLGNLEPALFAPQEMKTLSTHGLTFALDVPRVAGGVAAFDRMIAVARQLCHGLDGVLVDDNRAPLGDNSIAMIRKSIAQFHEQMQRQGIPPGGELALRLFS
ncbi:MAG: cell division protein ZipA C-terminal FtsZ-binding domain-containing protein [Pseudomonadota bacterium]|jgi:FtsZ-interacting cell division protein ZipA